MSRYAVYKLFDGCEAPSNISTFGGYLAGVKVGTSDKNPLDISDTTHHTSEPVRCKDCKHVYEHHDARGRWLLCNLPLYFEVKPEDFCSRGETEEDYSDDTD